MIDEFREKCWPLAFYYPGKPNHFLVGIHPVINCIPQPDEVLVVDFQRAVIFVPNYAMNEAWRTLMRDNPNADWTESARERAALAVQIPHSYESLLATGVFQMYWIPKLQPQLRVVTCTP